MLKTKIVENKNIGNQNVVQIVKGFNESKGENVSQFI